MELQSYLTIETAEPEPRLHNQARDGVMSA